MYVNKSCNKYENYKICIEVDNVCIYVIYLMYMFICCLFDVHVFMLII